MEELLTRALKKYGELAGANNIKKCMEIDSIKCGSVGFQKLKEFALKIGDVLEADQGLIIASVPVGAMQASRALLVARIGDGGVDVAAFYKEGLIKQHGARQAIDKLKGQLLL